MPLKKYAFEKLNEELTLKYGKPSSSNIGRSRSEMKWIFPSTEIKLSMSFIGDISILMLDYTMRKQEDML